MFTINATFLFALVSFLVYLWLMKLVFFDRLQAVKKARLDYVESSRLEADKALAEATQLQASLDERRQQLRRQSSEWLEEEYRAAKAQLQDKLASLKQAHANKLQAHQQELDSWQRSTEEALSHQRPALSQQVLNKLGLSQFIGAHH